MIFIKYHRTIIKEMKLVEWRMLRRRRIYIVDGGSRLLAVKYALVTHLITEFKCQYPTAIPVFYHTFTWI